MKLSPAPDEISIRDSVSSISEKSYQPLRNQEVMNSLSEEEFIPREVRKLEKIIEKKEADKF